MKNDKDKFGLHFKYTTCKISKRKRRINNQIDIQKNLRPKTTVACIRHCIFMSLFRKSLLVLILCVCLRRFTFLKDSPTQNEIIGSPFRVMDGTTFLTSTFFSFSQPRPVPLIFDINIQVDGIFVTRNNSSHFNGTTSKFYFLSLLLKLKTKVTI